MRSSRSSSGGGSSSKADRSSTAATTVNRSPPQPNGTDDGFMPRGLPPAQSAAFTASGVPRGESASYYGVATNPTTYSTASTVPVMPGSFGPAAAAAAATPSANGLASSASGAYSSSSFVANSYAETLQGGGQAYSNTALPAMTAVPPAPIPIPSAQTSSGYSKPTSGYKPTPVPQVSPYSSTAALGAYALASQGSGKFSSSQNGGSSAYYGSASSSSQSSGVRKFGGKPNPFAAGAAAGAAGAGLAMHHHHQHQHQAKSRSGLRKLWFKLGEEEREQIGRFEAWAEIQGMCRDCFTPGSSPADAPRKHHRGEKWTKNGWKVTKKSGAIFKTRGSSSVTSSGDDSKWSDSTRNRRRIQRRERKEVRRMEGMESRTGGRKKTSYKKAGLVAGAALAVGKAFGVSRSRKSSSSLLSKEQYSSSASSRSGGLRGSEAGAVFYDPGYTADGQTHPRYYRESSHTSVRGGARRSSDSPYENTKHSRSSSSFIGSIFGRSKRRSSVRSSGRSSLAYGDSSSTSGAYSDLAYGSSFGSSALSSRSRKKRGSRSTFSFFSSKSRSTSSSSSSDGLAFGGHYYSGSLKKKGSDSYSTRSSKSWTGSLASSVASAGASVGSALGLKSRRRKSWDDYGTAASRSSAQRSGGFGIGRHNSTGGSRAQHSSTGYNISRKSSSSAVGQGSLFGSGVSSVSRGSGSSGSWFEGGGGGGARSSGGGYLAGSRLEGHHPYSTSSAVRTTAGRSRRYSSSSSDASSSWETLGSAGVAKRKSKHRKSSGFFGGLFSGSSSKRGELKGKGKGKGKLREGIYVTEDGNIKKKTSFGDTTYIIQDSDVKKIREREKKAAATGGGGFLGFGSKQPQASQPLQQVPRERLEQYQQPSVVDTELRTTTAEVVRPLPVPVQGVSHEIVRGEFSGLGSSSRNVLRSEKERERERGKAAIFGGIAGALLAKQKANELYTRRQEEERRRVESEERQRQMEMQRRREDDERRERERIVQQEEQRILTERQRREEEARRRVAEAEHHRRLQEELARNQARELEERRRIEERKRHEEEMRVQVGVQKRKEEEERTRRHDEAARFEAQRRNEEEKTRRQEEAARFEARRRKEEEEIMRRQEEASQFEARRRNEEEGRIRRQEEATQFEAQRRKEEEEMMRRQEEAARFEARRRNEEEGRVRRQEEATRFEAQRRKEEEEMMRRKEEAAQFEARRRKQEEEERVRQQEEAARFEAQRWREEQARLQWEVEERGRLESERHERERLKQVQIEEEQLEAERQARQTKEREQLELARLERIKFDERRREERERALVWERRQIEAREEEERGRSIESERRHEQEQAISVEQERVYHIETPYQQPQQLSQEMTEKELVLDLGHPSQQEGQEKETADFQGTKERLYHIDTAHQQAQRSSEIREVTPAETTAGAPSPTLSEVALPVEQRVALEKQKAELEALIATEKRRAKRRAERRARRSTPEYKERDRQRSRERSKDREAERAAARKAEVEFVRRKLHLDDNPEKAVTLSELGGDGEELIDHFGRWENWRGSVPALIETRPTPPPGTPRSVPVVHCRGKDYFDGIMREREFVLPKEHFTAEPEPIGSTPDIVTAEPDIDDADATPPAAQPEDGGVPLPPTLAKDMPMIAPVAIHVPPPQVFDMQLPETESESSHLNKAHDVSSSAGFSWWEATRRPEDDEIDRQRAMFSKAATPTPITPATASYSLPSWADVARHAADDEIDRQRTMFSTIASPSPAPAEAVYGPELPKGFKWKEALQSRGSNEEYYSGETEKSLVEEQRFQVEKPEDRSNRSYYSGEIHQELRDAEDAMPKYYSGEQVHQVEYGVGPAYGPPVPEGFQFRGIGKKSASRRSDEAYVQQEYVDMFYGPSLPENYVFRPVGSTSYERIEGTSGAYEGRKPAREYPSAPSMPQGRIDVFYGPPLPENYVFRPGSTSYERIERTSGAYEGRDRKQSTYERAEAAVEVYREQELPGGFPSAPGIPQERVELFYGPPLPENYVFHLVESTSADERVEGTSRTYRRRKPAKEYPPTPSIPQEHVDVFYGPPLPENYVFHLVDHKQSTSSAYERTEAAVEVHRKHEFPGGFPSGPSIPQERVDVSYGPPLPENYIFHPVESVSADERIEGTSRAYGRRNLAREHPSGPSMLQEHVDVLYGPPLPENYVFRPVGSTSYERMEGTSRTYDRRKPAREYPSAPSMPREHVDVFFGPSLPENYVFRSVDSRQSTSSAYGRAETASEVYREHQFPGEFPSAPSTSQEHVDVFCGPPLPDNYRFHPVEPTSTYERMEGTSEVYRKHEVAGVYPSALSMPQVHVNVFYGPSLPDNYVFQPVESSEYERMGGALDAYEESGVYPSAPSIPRERVDVFYGPPLPDNYIFRLMEPSEYERIGGASAAYGSNRSTSSAYERTEVASNELPGGFPSAPSMLQEHVDVFCGPSLPDNYVFYPVDPDQSTSTYECIEGTSEAGREHEAAGVYPSSHSMSQEQVDVSYGPSLPENYVFRPVDYKQPTSEYEAYRRREPAGGYTSVSSMPQERVDVFYGPPLPENYDFHPGDYNQSHERKGVTSEISYSPPVPEDITVQPKPPRALPFYSQHTSSSTSSTDADTGDYRTPPEENEEHELTPTPTPRALPRYIHDDFASSKPFSEPDVFDGVDQNLTSPTVDSKEWDVSASGGRIVEGERRLTPSPQQREDPALTAIIAASAEDVFPPEVVEKLMNKEPVEWKSPTPNEERRTAFVEGIDELEAVNTGRTRRRVPSVSVSDVEEVVSVPSRREWIERAVTPPQSKRASKDYRFPPAALIEEVRHPVESHSPTSEESGSAWNPASIPLPYSQSGSEASTAPRRMQSRENRLKEYSSPFEETSEYAAAIPLPLSQFSSEASSIPRRKDDGLKDSYFPPAEGESSVTWNAAAIPLPSSQSNSEASVIPHRKENNLVATPTVPTDLPLRDSEGEAKASAVHEDADWEVPQVSSQERQLSDRGSELEKPAPSEPPAAPVGVLGRLFGRFTAPAAAVVKNAPIATPAEIVQGHAISASEQLPKEVTSEQSPKEVASVLPLRRSHNFVPTSITKSRELEEIQLPRSTKKRREVKRRNSITSSVVDSEASQVAIVREPVVPLPADFDTKIARLRDKRDEEEVKLEQEFFAGRLRGGDASAFYELLEEKERRRRRRRREKRERERSVEDSDDGVKLSLASPVKEVVPVASVSGGAALAALEKEQKMEQKTGQRTGQKTGQRAGQKTEQKVGQKKDQKKDQKKAEKRTPEKKTSETESEVYEATGGVEASKTSLWRRAFKAVSPERKVKPRSSSQSVESEAQVDGFRKDRVYDRAGGAKEGGERELEEAREKERKQRKREKKKEEKQKGGLELAVPSADVERVSGSYAPPLELSLPPVEERRKETAPSAVHLQAPPQLPERQLPSDVAPALPREVEQPLERLPTIGPTALEAPKPSHSPTPSDLDPEDLEVALEPLDVSARLAPLSPLDVLLGRQRVSTMRTTWSSRNALSRENVEQGQTQPSRYTLSPEDVILPASNPSSPYVLPELPWYLPPLPESPFGSPTLLPQSVGLPPGDLDSPHEPPAGPADLPRLPEDTPDSPAPLPQSVDLPKKNIEEREHTPSRYTLSPDNVVLPVSNPSSPYVLPELPWYLPPLPESPFGSPTLLPQSVGSPPSDPGSPHESPAGPANLLQLPEDTPDLSTLLPQNVDLPKKDIEEGEQTPPSRYTLSPEDVVLPVSNPSSPYALPERPWYLPPLPESPLGSPTLLQSVSLPPSDPGSPHESPAGPANLLQLPEDTSDLPTPLPQSADLPKKDTEEREQTPPSRYTLSPEDVVLPVSNPSSPYVLPELPWYLPPLPESPFGSPTLLPQSIGLPPSDSSSPHESPASPVNLLQLPESPLGPLALLPESVDLPFSDPGSPYELPAVPADLPQLPESPFGSPTLLPQNVSLPHSGPGSPHELPDLQQLSRSSSSPTWLADTFEITRELPPLALGAPASPLETPWEGVQLPESRPDSPYSLPAVPVDLPRLPESSPSSPTLLPKDVSLPSSKSGSPYLLPAIPTDLPLLPESSLSSPTLLPQEVALPASSVGSPYLLPEVGDLPELPPSDPSSPIQLPRDFVLPESRPDSPYYLDELPVKLPDLPSSPWYSPTFGPGPQDVELPTSTPGSPYERPALPVDLPLLPASPWYSPTSFPRPQESELPFSDPNSPYMLPAVPNDLPQLPASSFASPTLLPQEVQLPESAPDSPYMLLQISTDLPKLPDSPWLSPTEGTRPQEVELPESVPGSPYDFAEIPVGIPRLPESPWYSPTLGPRPQDVLIPDSPPDSPYELPLVPMDLPALPRSPWNSPTLGPRPQELSLPGSRSDSPFELPEVPFDLPRLPGSPWDSPTFGPRPHDVLMPDSAPNSPYQLPPVPMDLPALPRSPWNSPTLGPGPQELYLPGSRPDSPYELPEVPHDLPRLPGSPWHSPTLGPRPQELHLPGSRPDSPYEFAEVPHDLPRLPASPWNSPTLGPRPQELYLPYSRPDSPYELPEVPHDLPFLPASPWHSPTLGPRPQELSLPYSRPDSPYELPEVPYDLPFLPASPWHSPTLGPRPQELYLPCSRPDSPYELPEVPHDLPFLPASPWHSPTLGPRPQELYLPCSRPDSPYELPEVPHDLPFLPASPWHSPTLGPRPQELPLPYSRPDSPYELPEVPYDLPFLPASPWHSPTLGPRPHELYLPGSRPDSPYELPKVPRELPRLPGSPWHSPTLGPRPQELSLPYSRPDSPYELPEVPFDLPRLPSSPWHSPTLEPRPQELSLPASRPDSPFELPEVPLDLPCLPSSPWNSPTLGPRPQELRLPYSRPGSPYELPEVPFDLPCLPSSAWHSPTLGPRPQEVFLPDSRPHSPYELPEVPFDLPRLPSSPWHSPTLGPRPQELSLPASRPDSPFELPEVPLDLPRLPSSPWHSPTHGARPQEVELPNSRPGSPYCLPKVPDNLPMLPVSPWDSPTFGPRPQECELPESRPQSPWSLVVQTDLPRLPASPWDSPTEGPRPREAPLPRSVPGSPYELGRIVIPEMLEKGLPGSPWDSPTEGPGPREVQLPSSVPGSPYELQQLIIPSSLERALPGSPWDSPTHGRGPREVQLPGSIPGSPYDLQLVIPSISDRALPSSPWDSPTEGPGPREAALPGSVPWSPYELGRIVIPGALERGLPGSPWDSPTDGLGPREVQLPGSVPGSPYELQKLVIPLSLERALPGSPWDSPTDGRGPREVRLPGSVPGSPYELQQLVIPSSLGEVLPDSPWDSPTDGRGPREVGLPGSLPGSPYELRQLVIPSSLERTLPDSPWDSPTDGCAPQGTMLPESKPGSPYQLPEVSTELPLPNSPWDSPTLGPAPTGIQLPASRPGSPYSLTISTDLPWLPLSPWDSPTEGVPPQERSLPESKPGSPYSLPETTDLPRLPSSPWDSPTMGPRPPEVNLPPSNPNSPYALPEMTDLPALPASPLDSPTFPPWKKELPLSTLNSPYELAMYNKDLPSLPSSPWDSPTHGPIPYELVLPISKPGSPYRLPQTDVAQLAKLPNSPWDSPTFDPKPFEKELPANTPTSSYGLEFPGHLPPVPPSPFSKAVEIEETPKSPPSLTDRLTGFRLAKASPTSVVGDPEPPRGQSHEVMLPVVPEGGEEAQRKKTIVTENAPPLLSPPESPTVSESSSAPGRKLSKKQRQRLAKKQRQEAARAAETEMEISPSTSDLGSSVSRSVVNELEKGKGEEEGLVRKEEDMRLQKGNEVDDKKEELVVERKIEDPHVGPGSAILEEEIPKISRKQGKEEEAKEDRGSEANIQTEESEEPRKPLFWNPARKHAQSPGIISPNESDGGEGGVILQPPSGTTSLQSRRDPFDNLIREASYASEMSDQQAGVALSRRQSVSLGPGDIEKTVDPPLESPLKSASRTKYETEKSSTRNDSPVFEGKEGKGLEEDRNVGYVGRQPLLSFERGEEYQVSEHEDDAPNSESEGESDEDVTGFFADPPEPSPVRSEFEELASGASTESFEEMDVESEEDRVLVDRPIAATATAISEDAETVHNKQQTISSLSSSLELISAESAEEIVQRDSSKQEDYQPSESSISAVTTAQVFSHKHTTTQLSPAAPWKSVPERPKTPAEQASSFSHSLPEEPRSVGAPLVEKNLLQEATSTTPTAPSAPLHIEPPTRLLSPEPQPPLSEPFTFVFPAPSSETSLEPSDLSYSTTPSPSNGEASGQSTVAEVPSSQPTHRDPIVEDISNSVPAPPQLSPQPIEEESGKPLPRSESNSTDEASDSDVFVSVEADPNYEVFVSRVPGEGKRRGSIEIDISRPVNLAKPSPDSVTRAHSVLKESDLTVFKGDTQEELHLPVISPSVKKESAEEPRGKAFHSLFGGALPQKPTERESDPFTSKEADSQTATREFKLSRRHGGTPPPDRSLKEQTVDTPTRASLSLKSPELPTISEHKSDNHSSIEAQPAPKLDPAHPILRSVKRQASDNSYFGSSSVPPKQDQSPTPTNIPRRREAAATRFITSEDLISRIQSDLPRRAQSALSQHQRSELQDTMQVLKRGERSRAASASLRRVGSEIGTPRASSEHVIFGERFTTPERPGRAKDTTVDGVFEAFGDRAPEPISPTRPPSVTRRQSIMILDLEHKVETLGSENTHLIHEKANLEKSLAESKSRHKSSATAFKGEIEQVKKLLDDRNSQIEEMNKKIAWYQEEVTRLSNDNDSLSQTNVSLQNAYKQNYANLAGRFERKSEQLVQLNKSHEELQIQLAKAQQGVGMESRVRNVIQEKDNELEILRAELRKAREEVKNLQRKVTARQSNRYLDIKDPVHFAQSSHALFLQVQQWCDEFSRVSAGRRCVHVHRVTDDAIKERFENVMLDDRGVRRMLKDESRRSQIFAAITMRLIWEFVFTRYLFGLEVEERHRLLSLERTLAEVGAPGAVHQWRATTLTLLSQRHSFRTRLTTETEAAVQEIMRHLNFILPAPSQHLHTIISALRRIVTHAVDLAVEMRTQRAEYVMLRAPRPEYDDNGEVSNTVPFSSSRMSALNSDVSGVDLELEHAAVKSVLFPLVIRRGNEYGEEYEREHIVYKMQVLVNRSQLRSESRASTRTTSTVWREETAQRNVVNRLTPITDHSPRTTPEKPVVLPVIPENTIRLVEDDVDMGMEMDTAAGASRFVASGDKKRRIDER